MIELEPLIQEAKWKTQGETEYVTQQDEAVLYTGLKTIIKKHGYSKEEQGKWRKYLDYGKHTYYVVENTLNRREKK